MGQALLYRFRVILLCPFTSDRREWDSTVAVDHIVQYLVGSDYVVCVNIVNIMVCSGFELMD